MDRYVGGCKVKKKIYKNTLFSGDNVLLLKKETISSFLRDY